MQLFTHFHGEQVMTKNITIRLDDKLYEKLEKYAREHGMSRVQVIVHALELLFNPIDSAEDIKDVTLREIIVKYKTKCIKCNRMVDIGEIAYWGKNYGVLCYDCYLKANQKAIGADAKKLVKLYKEIRKLKTIKSELQREVDLLADKLNVYELLDELYSKLRNIETKIEAIITNLLHEQEDKQKFYELYNEVRDSVDKLNEIMYGLRRILIKAKKEEVKRKEIEHKVMKW